MKGTNKFFIPYCRASPVVCGCASSLLNLLPPYICYQLSVGRAQTQAGQRAMKCPAALCWRPVVEDAVVSTAPFCVSPTTGQQVNNNRNITFTNLSFQCY
jgi:hypothetical protein